MLFSRIIYGKKGCERSTIFLVLVVGVLLLSTSVVSALSFRDIFGFIGKLFGFGRDSEGLDAGLASGPRGASPAYLECDDTDGGLNYYEKGTAGGDPDCGYSQLTDVCVRGRGGADIRMLAEAYCQGNCALRKNYICENGCDFGKGVCIGDEPEFVDKCSLVSDEMKARVGSLMAEGETFVLKEGEIIRYKDYVVFAGDLAHLVRLTSVTNQTTGFDNDRVRFTDVITGDVYETTWTADGTGTITMGGRDNMVSLYGDSGSASEDYEVRLTDLYPGTTTFYCDYPQEEVTCGDGSCRGGAQINLSSSYPFYNLSLADGIYNVELISAGDTSATIKVTDPSGNSNSREIVESASRLIIGVEVIVLEADETNLRLSATLIVGETEVSCPEDCGTGGICIDSDAKNYYNKGYVTINTTNAGPVLFYDSCKNVTSPTCDSSGCGGSLVYRCSGSNCVVDEYVCDPVSGGLGHSPYPCPNGCRDGACVGDEPEFLDKCPLLSDEVKLEVGQLLTSGETVILKEGDVMHYHNYVVLAGDDRGYLLKITSVNNLTTGYDRDYVRFMDVLTGDMYGTLWTSEGVGTLTVGGMDYTVSLYGEESNATADHEIRITDSFPGISTFYCEWEEPEPYCTVDVPHDTSWNCVSGTIRTHEGSFADRCINRTHMLQYYCNPNVPDKYGYDIVACGASVGDEWFCVDNHCDCPSEGNWFVRLLSFLNPFD